MTARGAFGAALACAVGGGCTLLYPTSDLTRDTGEADASVAPTSDDAGSSTGADAAPTTEAGTPPSVRCPTGMVLIAAAKTPFCIDAKEATTGDYLDFLKNGNIDDQPAECGFNANFQPKDGHHGVGGDCAGVDVLAQNSDVAMSCVGWCDAASYCRYHEKRLCRGVGNVANTFGASDFATSEWYAACSSGGARAYPYGEAFESARCVDSAPRATASRDTCEGAVAGLFDMSGNVFEWDDTCQASGGASKDDLCRARGGAYLSKASKAADLRCDGMPAGGAPRGASFQSYGIRCCADAIPK